MTRTHSLVHLQRQSTERAVWPPSIVLPSPRFDRCSRVGKACKPVGVQTLLSEASVEALNEGIFYRLPRTNEIELDLMPVRPLIEHLRDELRSVVHGDPPRTSSKATETTQYLDDVLSGQRCTDLDGNTLTGKVIDYRQGSKSATVCKGIGHEVHAPALISARRHRPGLTLSRTSPSSWLLRTHR